MPRSNAVDHVLPGQSAPTLRIRPLGAVPCGLLALGVAALPITPVWLWLLLIVAISAVPWVIGTFWRTGTGETWRLSSAGLECLGKDGTVRVAYSRRRIEEFVLTTEDDTLFVLHKFGGTEIGSLTEMGFDRFAFFVTARRIGIPVHVLDGDQTVFDADETAAPPGRTVHRRLLAQEAELLRAVHEPVEADPAATVPSRLTRPLRCDPWLVALGVSVSLLGAYLTLRLVLAGAADPDGFSLAARLTAVLWLSIATGAAVVTRRYWLRRAPLEWTVTADHIHVRHRGVGEWRVHRDRIGVLCVATGPVVVPSEPDITEELVVIAFDHQLDVVARLPAADLDSFELAHVLSEHGYTVVTDDARRARPTRPGYGLEGLPDIFKKVPGGRLVVDDGIGWADASGETVLRLPRERLGRLELLTVNGQAWLRLYDADGDEFFTAPLSVLRTSRTALRDSARRAGLPVTDAEYDAYESAVLHRAFGPGAATVGEPGDPEARDGAGGVEGAGGDAGDGDTAASGGPDGTKTAEEGGNEFLIDSSRTVRQLSCLFLLGLAQVFALICAVLLRGGLDGFWRAWLWCALAGLVIGALGAWRYDRHRPQVRVSTTGIAAVRRRGRTQWRLDREVIGGVGVDRSNEDGRARLVVWNPAGRLLRMLPVGPHVRELRRACEQCGLPWGPPGSGATPPPPEL